jgi:hypothetical protein
VGKAVYPEDGLDAEKLLSEADKRMYLQKQSQPSRSNRRLYRRMRVRVTTEITMDAEARTVLGIITNLSINGCYVETSVMLLPGSRITLSFQLDQAQVVIQSEVLRMDMGVGAAIRFSESTHEVRATLQRVLEQLASAEGIAERQRSLSASALTL